MSFIKFIKEERDGWISLFLRIVGIIITGTGGVPLIALCVTEKNPTAINKVLDIVLVVIGLILMFGF